MILYIDPGTGSMLFSLAIGLVSVAWFGARKLYMSFKYRTTGKVDTSKKDIVIFGEDKRYWTTFKGVLDEFEKRQVKVTYLAGSEDDPLLSEPYQFVETEVIGLGNKSYAKLNFLNARIVLATTPGLDVYQWKRSKDVDFYVHLTHSIGAATGYRMFGVEFFDAILFASDIFTPRLREIEEKRGSKPKEIVAVGCTYMDYLLERKEDLQSKEHETTLLVAPSWGSNGILTRYGETFIDELIATGFNIIVRPHPQSFIAEKELMQKLQNKYKETEHFHWNRDPDNFDALASADILISDFSGVIYDYAFIFEKPVMYTAVDMDVSVLDEAWVDEPYWGTELLPRLGRELNEEDFPKLKEIIEELTTSQSYTESIRTARDEYWQNRGHSAEAVVDYLTDKSNTLREDDK